MAIYHLSVKQIKRGEGKSALGAACYRAGIEAENLYDGQKFDYTNKRWIEHNEVMLPDHVQKTRPEYKDISALWNAVELSEKSSDSKLATEIEIALPRELNLDQQIKLTQEFVKENFVNEGMCALISIHHPPKMNDLAQTLDKNGNPTNDYKEMDFNSNPHAHIMLTCRPIDKNGKWESKSQIEYICKKGNEEKRMVPSEFKIAKSEGWEKQYKYKNPEINKTEYHTPSEAEKLGWDHHNRVSKQPKTNKFGRLNPTMARWSESQRVIEWRQSWEQLANRHLKECGYDISIDSRSLEAQGRTGEMATIHMGPEAILMERRRTRLIKEGKDPMSFPHSDKYKLNQSIKDYNNTIREAKQIELAVNRKIDDTNKKLAEITNKRNTLIKSKNNHSIDLSVLQRMTDKDVSEEQKYKDSISLIMSLNQKTLDLISALQLELSKCSIIDIQKRNEIQQQIHIQSQKLSDRNTYLENMEKRLSHSNTSIDKKELNHIRQEINNLNQQIDLLEKEYKDILQSVPDEYKSKIIKSQLENRNIKIHSKVHREGKSR